MQNTALDKPETNADSDVKGTDTIQLIKTGKNRENQWDAWLASLPDVPEDFMAERDQPIIGCKQNADS